MKYAVLTLAWDYEQVAPQVAIVHGLTNRELEDVVDDINNKHRELDEDECGIDPRQVVAVLRRRGFTVDVPEEVVQMDSFNGCELRSNKEEDLADGE